MNSSCLETWSSDLIREPEYEIPAAWKVCFRSSSHQVLEARILASPRRAGILFVFLKRSLVPRFCIPKLLNVGLSDPHHLYWPDVDVDLAEKSTAHPKTVGGRTR